MTHPVRPIDLLIEARWIVPVEPAGEVLENHAVAIDDGRIVAIAPQGFAAAHYAAKSRCVLAQHLLIPGLVNLHTHAAMSLLRGLADDLPLMDWLQKHIWPAETEHVSAKFVRDGTALACAEMLRSGITCFNDMYFFPQAAAEAAVAAGMRAAIGLITVEFASAYATDADDYLSKGLTVRDLLLDEPLLSFCLAPHAPYTVEDGSFARVLTLAEQIDLPIHLHIHETVHEIDEGRQRYGIRPIERLRRLGLLSPALIGVHAVHLEAHEIDLLAEHGCSVAHCPSSNLKLASGIAPIAALAESGVNLGLGTDGAASNNRLDILQEMRLAALLAKAQSARADALDAHRVLEMATLAGARALALDSVIGSIAPGKFADLTALRIDDPTLMPCYDPVSHLVYCLGREHVSAVWVAGQQRVKDGQLIENNENDMVRLATLWQNKIRP